MLLDIGKVLVALFKVARIDRGVVVDVGGLGAADGAAEGLDVAWVFPVAAWGCGDGLACSVDLL